MKKVLLFHQFGLSSVLVLDYLDKADFTVSGFLRLKSEIHGISIILSAVRSSQLSYFTFSGIQITDVQPVTVTLFRIPSKKAALFISCSG